jgi:hypothetical protein
LAVAEELKRRGYRVWIDLEQMRGEMNQRMAEAVEGAAIVCPFISRQYKKSPNCMKELNYADQLGKTFLPIIADDSDRGEVIHPTSRKGVHDDDDLPDAFKKSTAIPLSTCKRILSKSHLFPAFFCLLGSFSRDRLASSLQILFTLISLVYLPPSRRTLQRLQAKVMKLPKIHVKYQARNRLLAK